MDGRTCANLQNPSDQGRGSNNHNASNDNNNDNNNNNNNNNKKPQTLEAGNRKSTLNTICQYNIPILQ